MKRPEFTAENQFYTEGDPFKTLRAAFIFRRKDRIRFFSVVNEIARQVKPRISGYTVDLDSERSEHYVTNNSRYRSSVTSADYIQAYQMLAKRLKQEKDLILQTFHSVGAWTDDITPQADFRTVIGLRRGYDSSSQLHTIEEVKALLPNNLGLFPSSIYAIGGPGDLYTEPSVLITSPLCYQLEVYQAARQLGQERLFMEMRTGTSFEVSFME